jgi:hypothetical protein
MLHCTGSLKKTTVFKSNFEAIKTHTWTTSEYAFNLEKDWQVTNDRLECLVSHENRQVHLLSHELNADVSVLETVVRVGFYNQKIINSNKNWAGFCIGSKGRLVDSTDTPNAKDGINIGICTNGALFIGEPGPKNKNKAIINKLKGGVDLKVLITHKNNSYTIDFSVLEIDSGKELAHISRNGLVAEQLTGHLALISHFEETNQLLPKKSVWFKDWTLKGSKFKRRGRNGHV